MTRKAYEIEILFYTGGAWRLGKAFGTQKAAREWCGRQGLKPVFGGARPSMFWKPGMQATIYAKGSRLWLEGSTEGRAARRIAGGCV